LWTLIVLDGGDEAKMLNSFCLPGAIFSSRVNSCLPV
jgi:hypothetical protein